LKGDILYATFKYLAAIAARSLFATGAPVQSAKDTRSPSLSVAIADDKGSAIYGVTIPAPVPRLCAGTQSGRVRLDAGQA